jgi:hypothetical protein
MKRNRRLWLLAVASAVVIVGSNDVAGQANPNYVFYNSNLVPMF